MRVDQFREDTLELSWVLNRVEKEYFLGLPHPNPRETVRYGHRARLQAIGMRT